MRLTVAGQVLEVAPGTPLAHVLEVADAPAHRWCGSTRLDLAHRAGRHPLLDGALLEPGPGGCSVPPRGPHLEVVAGPDAGAVVEVDRPLTVGRAGDVSLADPALSARHLEVRPDGTVRDLGSANGSRVRRAGRRSRIGQRPRLRLDAGDLVEIGATVVRWGVGGDDAQGAADNQAAVQAGTDRAPHAEPPRRAALGAGALGASMGGIGIGVMTGRWALALALATLPLLLIAGGAAWARWRSRGQAAPPAPGMLALADVPLPVAIRGAPAAVRHTARALALAHGAALPTPLHEPWMTLLPRTMPEGSVVPVPASHAPPTEAATVIDLDAATLRTHGPPRAWEVTGVSARNAELAARRTHRTAAALPRTVRWAELEAPDAGGAAAVRAAPLAAASSPRGRPRRLVAALGTGTEGTVMVDLDRDGPHLLVAGTTGSGKSMLLETLVSALAWEHGPGDLAVALIDFKGGAGLRPCMTLPHVCGTLTDLDAHLARRALAGLAAEVDVRKRALAHAGHASWQEWEEAGEAPPRLLVVIDEFQELASRDRAFIPDATRLAAQGRALGIHMVLATQRPAGAVTADIRANVGSVLALRVASVAESQDLVGDGSAAHLAANRPGHAVFALAAGTVEAQVALPLAAPRPPVHRAAEPPPDGPRLAQAAAARWEGAAPPGPLWLPPLPARLPATPRMALLTDRPAERAQVPLRWDPASGPCVVLGPRGSGRTTALRSLAAALDGAARVVWLPRDAREAARTLTLVRAWEDAVLLIDDAQAAVDSLARAEGTTGDLPLEETARAVPVALAAAPGWSARWASRASLRILLGGLDPTERTLWGVPPALTDVAAIPGRAVCGTAESWSAAQVAVPGAPAAEHPLVVPLALPDGLPGSAVGVGGDQARPLRAPDSALVVGPAGPERDAVARTLRGHGTEVRTATDPFGAEGATWTVVVDPRRAELRRWGITVEPGLVDPDPPPGRVLVLAAGRALAAQLRA